MKERRVLELKVLAEDKNVVCCKVEKQSHRRNDFSTNKDGMGFVFGGHRLDSVSCPEFYDNGLPTLFVRGDAIERDNDLLIIPRKIFYDKILPAVRAYNETNGGFDVKSCACDKDKDGTCPNGHKREKWFPEDGKLHYFVYVVSRGGRMKVGLSSCVRWRKDDKDDIGLIESNLVFPYTDEGKAKAYARIEELYSALRSVGVKIGGAE